MGGEHHFLLTVSSLCNVVHVMKQQKTEAPRGDFLRTIAVFTAILGISFLLYCNSISNQFVFDDIHLIVENPFITKAENFFQIIGLKTGQPLYRPVRYVTYLMDYAISGLNPVSYHVSNIFYHSLTAFMLFVLVRRLAGSTAVALACTLLFTAHPVHTESVAYISGRRDILSCLFFLSGFYCFLRFRQTHRNGYIALIVVSFILAVGAKEMAVTLPAVCLLYDLICTFPKAHEKPSKRCSTKPAAGGRLRPYIILAVPCLFYLYYKLFLHYPSFTLDYYGGSIINNFATVLRILVRYLGLVFFPVVLHADYSYNAFPVSYSFFNTDVLLSVLIVAAVIGLTIAMRKKQQFVFFGGMWFFITLLPVCHILPHHDIMADHYLYIPSIGAILALCPLLQYLFKHKRSAGIVFLAVIFGLFSVRTIVRNRDWKDPVTMWTKVLQNTPECARAHCNLGVALAGRGSHGRAARHYREALRIHPEYVDAHYNLGAALSQTGMQDKAIEHYTETLRLHPGYKNTFLLLGAVLTEQGRLHEAIKQYQDALKKRPRNVKARNNLGLVFLHQGKLHKAMVHFRRVLRLRPNNVIAHNNLAVAYIRNGNISKAITHFKKVARLRPEDADVHNNMGLALLRMERQERAITCFQKALKADPDNITAHNNLGVIFKKLGDIEKAVYHFAVVAGARPENAEAHNNLGIVLMEKGSLNRAIEHFTQALRIDPAAARVHNNIGAAFLRTGNVEGAIEAFRKAVALQPDFYRASRNLKKALAMKAGSAEHR